MGIIYFTTAHCATQVTDNQGNVYISANAFAADGNAGSTDIWYAANSLGGVTQITVHTCGVVPQVYFAEVSGIAPTSSVEAAVGASNQPASSLAQAPQVMTNSRSFVFSLLSTQYNLAGLSPTSPFTPMALLDGDSSAFYMPAQAGSFGAAWDQQGSGGTYCGSTVAFKPAW